MKIIETLTTQQKIDLISGSVVGIFPYIIQSTDAFFDKQYPICLGYYLNRSGEKTISPTYTKILELVSLAENNDKTSDEIIGKLIREKFIEKWTRIYNTLLASQYDAINNKEFTETKTGNNQNKDTYNSQNAKVGTDTDTITFDTMVTNDGNSAVKETTTRNDTENNSTYGFNSSIAVPTSDNTDTSSETLTASADDNTTHNQETKTGTESKSIGLNHTDSKTGFDTKDITINETITNSGRDISAPKLIQEELDLRNSNIFFDIIYADIDSVTTIQIYI